MKYLSVFLLLITTLACEKQDVANTAAVTIRLTNETSEDLFNLESLHDDSFYGDIAANESATFEYSGDTEFAYGQVYPSWQKARRANGDSITLQGTGYCGVGLTFSTATPGIYDFSIQYNPIDTFEIRPGVPYIQRAYYSIVPKT